MNTRWSSFCGVMNRSWEGYVQGCSFSCLSKLIRTLTVLDLDLNVGLFNLLSVHTHAGSNDVASLYSADTLGSASQNDVSFFKCHDSADIGQLSRNLEEHEIGVVVLLHLAVDAQKQLNVMRVGDLGLCDGTSDWEEGVKPLCNAPWKTLLLGLLLDVTASHVNSEKVTFDGVQSTLSIVGVKVSDLTTHDKTQLNFVMDIDTSGTQYGTITLEEDR